VRRAPLALVDVAEKEWDFQLFNARAGLATTLGWTSYHTLRSRGSQPGYPDRTLWKQRHLFAELKRELTGRKSEDANRRPKPAQVAILDGLATAGAEVYLWRPSDLDEVARILGRPWTFAPARPLGTAFDEEWATTPTLSIDDASIAITTMSPEACRDCQAKRGSAKV